jgi:alcohol dehydrogenase (cytochrome c)
MISGAPHVSKKQDEAGRVRIPGGAHAAASLFEIRVAKPSFRTKILVLALPVLLALAAAPLLSSTYRWSSIVAARKMLGLLPDVSWADLRVITRPELGFELRRLAWTGDAYVSIHDPLVGMASARSHGLQFFRQTCERCHGAAAHGGLGPALVGRPLAHGGSDWALYHTITDGVPRTAMQGQLIARADTWLVIAYLRALEGDAAADGPRADLTDPDTAGLGAAPDTTYTRLVESSRQKREWLLPGGSYDSQRFSSDTEINTGNVSSLAVRWIHQFAGVSILTRWSSTPQEQPNEAVPIVAGDRLYVTTPPDTVYALDARGGAQLWSYARPLPADLHMCCLATNRGVAVLGRRVYVGTLDAHLVALDASTGQVVWDRAVADYTEGFSITSAPLPVGDLIVTGIGGGDFAGRGFLAAYDAATGTERWRFNTVPDPGEPGGDTWDGHEHRGGAATWGTGSYDPELGLLYWGVGNPAPDYDASVRRGDNLYSDCMLALDARSGRLVWHFQFLPGDDHDWDSIQTPSLIDVEQDGVPQKWLAVANRGGFFYVLDRRTGRFIRGAPFARQTWALGLSPSGRPIPAPNSHPTPQGTFLYPGDGATNSSVSAYSPLANLYYVDVAERGSLFFLGPRDRPRRGSLYLGGYTTTESTTQSDLVRAIDPMTAKVRWERHNATVVSAPRGGLLATAGGLVLGSDGSRLFALDAANGRELWSFAAGGQISGAPISFVSGGRQVIAAIAGRDLLTFAVTNPEPALQGGRPHALPARRPSR